MKSQQIPSILSSSASISPKSAAFPIADGIVISAGEKGQQKDFFHDTFSKISKTSRGWQLLSDVAGDHSKTVPQLAKFINALANYDVLILPGGTVAIRSIRNDETRLNSHSAEYLKKKFLEVSPMEKPPSSSLPVILPKSVYPNETKAIRGIIHTIIEEITSREELFSNVVDVLNDVNSELRFRGRPIEQSRVERLALRHAGSIAETEPKTHFFTKRGTEMLEQGQKLWKAGNYPALVLSARGANRRYYARIGSIAPIIKKANARLEKFYEYMRHKLPSASDTESNLIFANLAAIRLCSKWQELSKIKFLISKCYSEDRNAEIEKLKRNAYRIMNELKKSKNPKSIRALYKYKNFFSPEDMDAIMAESKNKKPDFESVFRRIAASYWEWKFGAVLRDDYGNPIRDRLEKLAKDFTVYEVAFKECEYAKRLLERLVERIYPKKIIRLKDALLSAPAGKEYELALEAYKKELAARPTFSEISRIIGIVQAELEKFKAEEASDSFETKGA